MTAATSLHSTKERVFFLLGSVAWRQVNNIHTYIHTYVKNDRTQYNSHIVRGATSLRALSPLDTLQQPSAMTFERCSALLLCKLIQQACFNDLQATGWASSLKQNFCMARSEIARYMLWDIGPCSNWSSAKTQIRNMSFDHENCYLFTLTCTNFCKNTA